MDMETKEETKIDSEETPKETLEDKFARLDAESKDLKARVEKAEGLAEEKDKGFRTLQERYRRRFHEEPFTEESKATAINKKIIDELERQRNPNYADDADAQVRIQALRNELTTAEREETRKAQMRRQESLSEESKGNLEDKIREAGQDPDDEKFDVVWTEWRLSSLADGKFDNVENKLGKILTRMKPKETEEVKPVDDEKKTEAEMRERIEREVIEKYNLNPEDKLTPKGSADADKQIRENYRNNPGDKKALREYLAMKEREG